MRYKAFVSYRRSSDEAAAATLQHELERFARRWYRPIRHRIFRDRTGATVGGALDEILRIALRDSEFLILLASPESAAAPWVEEEVRQWCDDERPLDRLLIVLTDGTIDWDADAKDFVWGETTAVPRVLSGRFTAMPSYLDLRWTRDPALDENARRGLWREAVATLSAKLLGVPREELIGEEIRERRRLRRAAASVITTLTFLVVLSLWLAYRAEMRRRVASSRQVALQALLAPRADEGLLLAVSALSIADTNEARGALVTRLQTNRRLRRVLHGHTSDVTRVALLDDGTCASGDMQGVILLHRFRDGRSEGELRGHDSQITALAAVPRSRTLISADDSGRVLFWSLPARTGQAPAGWSSPTGVGALAVTADGALAAAGDDDGVLSIVDAGTRSLRHRFPIAEREIEALSWIGTHAVVAGTTTGHVLVVSTETGTIERQWKVSAADIVMVGVLPDGTVFAVDGSGTLAQWSGAESSRVQLAREIMSAAYDPVHDVIAASDVGGAMQLYSRETGAPVIQPLAGHALMVSHAAFSRDGRFLISGSFDDSAMLWDLQQVHPIVTAHYRFADQPVPRILGDGTAAVFLAEEHIERWRLARSGPVDGRWLHDGPARLFAASADGARVAWTTRGKSAELWLHDGRNRKLGKPYGVLRRLSMSDRGAYVAVADDANGVGVWRVRDGRYWEVPDDRKRFITTLAFSRDERWLAVGDERGGLRLFATDTGVLVAAQSRVHADPCSASPSTIGEWLPAEAAATATSSFRTFRH